MTRTEMLENPVVVKMPAGEYWLGDPSYALSEDDYNELLNETNFFQDGSSAKTKSGRIVCAFSTAYGDGIYDDNYGNSYGVDSGLLGLVECMPEDAAADTFDWLVRVMLPKTDCTNTRGVLSFGRYIIDTRVNMLS